MFEWEAYSSWCMPRCSIYIHLLLRGYEADGKLNILVLFQRLILILI